MRPVLEFDMVDPRFIQESDVLAALDQRPNLMELSPSEFEGLIRDLFEKMGLDTKQTQASRDGGVDCVAYDPRPIFGGKVIIQAKRYKHTVGVSAVRELYGTMQNEGASKGILVTTSGYGKSSFQFAEGKPLELLSGTQLLYLRATAVRSSDGRVASAARSSSSASARATTAAGSSTSTSSSASSSSKGSTVGDGERMRSRARLTRIAYSQVRGAADPRKRSRLRQARSKAS